jgi:hypothetical protein
MSACLRVRGWLEGELEGCWKGGSHATSSAADPAAQTVWGGTIEKGSGLGPGQLSAIFLGTAETKSVQGTVSFLLEMQQKPRFLQ